MVGLSSRFFKAGYAVPKYQLDLNGASLFRWVVSSFSPYFESEQFLFICRPDYDTPHFVEEELKLLGVGDFRITVLGGNTRGQAETVALGLRSHLSDTKIYIFNIDTIHFSFRKDSALEALDGYLEVFQGEGNHWSFVEPGPDGIVRRTTEKDRISSLCSNGLYYFRSSDAYLDLFERFERTGDSVNGEFYIAPMYNALIHDGGKVGYKLVEIMDMGLCGTPDEYVALQSDPRVARS